LRYQASFGGRGSDAPLLRLYARSNTRADLRRQRYSTGDLFTTDDCRL
jgi:hypothetical protein